MHVLSFNRLWMDKFKDVQFIDVIQSREKNLIWWRIVYCEEYEKLEILL